MKADMDFAKNRVTALDDWTHGAICGFLLAVVTLLGTLWAITEKLK